MPSPAKTAGLAAGAAAVLTAGWLIASTQAGLRAETELRALADQPAAHASLRLAQLHHTRGLFSSSGDVEVQLVNTCSPAGGGGTAPSAARLHYTLSHLLLPTSAVRFDWTLEPLGEAGAVLAKAFGGQARLAGQGQVGYGGTLSSSLALPALAYNGDDGQQLRISPSTGRVAWGPAALAVDWRTDDISARGNGQAVVLKKLVLALDLSNRWRGTGTAQLGVEQLSTGLGTLDGLQFSSHAKEHGDQLDIEVRQSLRSTTLGGKPAKDLALAFGVRNVHGPSLETITRIASDTCGLHNITAEEDGRLRAAVGQLLAQGFSAGITQLAGSVGDGSVDGQLTVALSPSKAGAQAPVNLAAQLRSSGKLVLRGAVFSPQQQQMAVAMGFATQTPAGLEAAFDYADGLFKANGRTFDAGQVQVTLARADREINGFLARPATALALARPPATAPVAERVVAAQPVMGEPDTPPAEAPATAPVAAPAPATAPAPAPATAPAPRTPVADAAPEPAAAPADCLTVQGCATQTLRAAAKEDVDAVRTLATRLDALPKPDLGNKAQARKHNADGLAALAKDDSAAAIAAFQRGLQENPRDVELAGNLGFAQVRAGQAAAAVATLTQALVLDPRRTSTWTPLAEALALSGRQDDALAALWVGWQWSANREKSLAFYTDRAEKERATRPALARLYAAMAAWAGGGQKPALTVASR